MRHSRRPFKPACLTNLFGSQYDELIDFNAIPLYPHAAEDFGAKDPFNILLRPDNYVGFISQGISPGELEGYVNKFAGVRKIKRP